MERTLVIVKPDGVQRGLIGDVLGRLESKGLKVVGMKMIWIDKELASRHYAVHTGKPFFAGLIDYITSCPVVVAVFEGRAAVQMVRNVAGATDPLTAAPGTIRGDFALEIGRNIIHGSDSVENAATEIPLFFGDDELFAWGRNTDRWISE